MNTTDLITQATNTIFFTSANWTFVQRRELFLPEMFAYAGLFLAAFWFGAWIYRKLKSL